MKKMIMFGILIYDFALSCPPGQHSECILPRPWGGCAQSICVPNIENPLPNIQKIIEEKAFQLAITGKEQEKIKNREDCMVLVTAGLTAWGAASGGPIGALVGGASGIAAASLACRNIFPL